jgi:hypothetical protein
MAHWAQIDDNNKVVQIIKINDEDYDDEGKKWVAQNLEGKWIKTSINTKGGIHYDQDDKPDGGIALRKNYAIIGGSYDESKDAFIAPKPEPFKKKNGDILIDYVLNEESCLWEQIFNQ